MLFLVIPRSLLRGGFIQLQQQGEQRPMVRRELACKGECQLRALVLQGPER